MKAKLCDKCHKLLPQEGNYQIPVMWVGEDTGGLGRVASWICRDLCESCARGVVEAINGTDEIKFKPTGIKTSRIDRKAIIKLHKEGKQTKEICIETGYSESTVRRTVAAYKEKAAPK